MPRRRPAVSLVLAVALALPAGCTKSEGDRAGAAADPDPAADGDVEPSASAGPAEPAPGASRGSGRGGIAGLARDLIVEARAAPPDALELIPARAEMIMHVDFAALRGLSVYASMRDGIAKQIAEEDAGTALGRMATCSLDVEKLSTFTLGMAEEHFVGVVVGEGFGKPASYQCLLDHAKADAREPKWSIVEVEGEKRMVEHDDDSTGYFLGDDVLIMVDKELAADVAPLRAREDSAESAAKGPLGPTIDRVIGKHAWIAARVQGSVATAFSSAPMDKAREVWASAALAEDVALHFGVRADAASDAKALREHIEQGLDQARSMYSVFGLPSDFGDRLKLEQTDDVVALDVTLAKADLERIATTLRGFM